MTRSDGTGRLRFAGALLLAATFAVGALGGLAFGDFGENDQAVADAREPDCDDHDGRRGSYLDRLELTAEQQQRIDVILQERKEQMDAFWAENGPRMEQIVDSARAEIRNVLTADQRAQVDRMREERRARHEREKAACAEKMKQDSVAEGTR
jgi:Spy/CpxP family protein refolding chaperone